MNSLKLYRKLFFVIIALLFSTHTDSIAQDVNKLSEMSLEELMNMTVTVQKKEEKIQEVPLSVTVFSSTEAANYGIKDMSTLSALAPGFYYSRSGSDARPSMRGVTTRQIGPNGDPTLGYFIDGIYQARTSQGMIPFFDIERVEIHRGPQGTFYGRNTLGGNISVVSKKPGELEQSSISAEYGAFNHFNVQAFYDKPFSENVKLRLAFLYEKHDGYAENLFNGGVLDANGFLTGKTKNALDEQQFYFKGALSIAFTHNFNALFRVNYWTQGGAGNGVWGHNIVGTLVDPKTGKRSLFGAISKENPRAALTGRLPNPQDPMEFRVNRPSEREGKLKLFSTELSYNLDFATIKSLTSYTKFEMYRDFDSDFTELDNTFETLSTPTEVFSHEMHIASNTNKPFDWIFGAYYLNEKESQRWFFDAVGSKGDLDQFIEGKNISYAAFGQISYNFTDALRMTLGGRYTTDSKDYYELDFPNFSATSRKELSFSKDFSNFTGKVGLDYVLTENNFIYAMVSTGFKSGGFNSVTQAPTFNPETVNAFEFGSKNTILEKRLQLNLALFYNQFKDVQVNTYDNASKSTFFTNAGKASAKGVEIEAKYIPVNQLQIQGMLSYCLAKYDKFESTNNPFYSKGSQDTSFLTVDLSGKKIERSPELKLGLSISYMLEVADYGYLTPAILAQHVGDYYTTQYNTIIDKQSVYTKLDLSLTWENSSGSYYVKGYVNNLGNEIALENATFGGSQALFGNYSYPRTYGIKVGVRM